jgi:uncharacterized membrane protein (UPF0127 family)
VTPLRRLRNCTTGDVVAQRIGSPVTPWERALGFLRRRTVERAEGLWFAHCAAVHTIGMRATIDIVFVDRDQTVVRLIPRAGRNRVFTGGARAAATLELAAGVAQTLIRLGDRLELD